VTGLGIGINAQQMTGLNRETVVGRRDLFKMPDFDARGNITAKAKKPPIKRPAVTTRQEETKSAVEFNLAGTQIG
jgi:hypothetical protein